MKHILLLLTLFLIILSCDPKSTTPLESSETSEATLDSNLIFNSIIGHPDLQTKVLVFDLPHEKYGKRLKIKLEKERESIFTDTLTIDMDTKPLVELTEINGDGTKDLVIEYLRPGRGGNYVVMAFIFDTKEMVLKKVSNSIFFPNLVYDENLGFVSSFRFYGGFSVQMDFLEIKGDTLCPKYQIIKEDQEIYLKKMEKGNWIESGVMTLDSADVIIPEIIELEPEIKIKNAS